MVYPPEGGKPSFQYGKWVVPPPLPNPHYEQLCQVMRSLAEQHGIHSADMKIRHAIVNTLVVDVAFTVSIPEIHAAVNYLKEKLLHTVQTMRITLAGNPKPSLLIY